MRNIHALLDTLTEQEIAELKTALLSNNKLSGALNENSPNKESCPHCNSKRIVKNGKNRNVQRYRCKDCNATFGVNTNTFVHKTQKPLATWDRYIQLMLDGFTIRRIAGELEISTKTAFYWRHKILNALKKVISSQLNGIIEADETFFRLSYKGQKKDLPRKARKRGGEAGKSGTSKEQVCVLTAIDRNKTNWMKPVCLGKLSTQNLMDNFAKQITTDSVLVTKRNVLVTDKHRAYIQFCEDLELQHEAEYAGVRRTGAYHMQNVNALHSQLKRFMRRFNGVATKYLDNYLVYWQWRNRDALLQALASKHAVVSYKALSSARMTLA